MLKYCYVCKAQVEEIAHPKHTEKECVACKETKKLHNFPISENTLDGHQHTCLECKAKRRATNKQSEERQREQRYQVEIQRKKNNALLKAYGYRWKKEEVFNEWDEDVREEWVLYNPGKEVVSVEQGIQEITQLQAHHPGHPSTLWANDILALPNVVILDTETTGTKNDDEIIDLAIIDTQARIRVNSLFQCQKRIPPDTIKIHHITDNIASQGRTFPAIWEKLMLFLSTREIVIYNAEFDLRMLIQTSARYHLPMPNLRTHCLMKQFSSYVGGVKERYSLEAACYHFGIEQPSAHRALVDTQVSLKVLQEMAKLTSVLNKQ